MTCNDCINFDVCIARGDIATKELLDGAEIDCDFFKNKADYVEVVRCKDCRFWGGVTFGYICRRFSGSYIRNETRENDFCSYGERRDT